ncbi:MAG: DUF1028 domain-containing protein [Ignisphaera sp.]|nr:DUF1028 domain-containing protein [Ignisphaera sp.]MCX8167687.1 DUF1028 domain-containing protein [Ignisphaera sp.]MDW8085677.1 DUF1028 domain-containing protein [Ignisphaera sp.]
MTFSIVAVDREKGDIGVAVSSKFISVGSVVPWVKVGVGAVATQAWANVKFGPILLYLLENRYTPKQAVELVLSSDPKREHRQIGVVSAKGEAYAYTGASCIPYAGHIVGDGFAVQGNILAGEEVVESMAKAFENTKGELVDKLLAALKAGDSAGGDKRGKQSAAIIVLRPCGGYGGCLEGVDKYVDLRVDDHPDPVNELIRLFEIWELTILEREDPSDVYSLSEVAQNIQLALKKLGYYRGEVDGVLNNDVLKALELWMGINNFENKIRSDSRIWGSVYRFLMKQAGLSTS